MNNTKKKPEKQMDSRGAEHKHEEIERSFLPVSKLKEERGSMIEETGSQQRESRRPRLEGEIEMLRMEEMGVLFS